MAEHWLDGVDRVIVCHQDDLPIVAEAVHLAHVSDLVRDLLKISDGKPIDMRPTTRALVSHVLEKGQVFVLNIDIARERGFVPPDDRKPEGGDHAPRV